MKSILIFVLFTFPFFCSSQTLQRLKKCGWYCKDTAAITMIFKNQLQYIEVKNGEKIASVGAQAGNLEILMSLYKDSIDWTLEDIDSICLNENNINHNIKYYEQLASKKLKSTFKIVLGTESKLMLPENNFDRVLLINTYHEITNKNDIILSIYKILKPKGRLVVHERMTAIKGTKRRDCHHEMPFEPELFKMFADLKFKLISKKEIAKTKGQTYYVFERD